MEALNRKAKNDLIEKYQALKLKESLSKPHLYLFACIELSFLLKNAYSRFPKDLQSLIFQETLFAFSLLHEVQTQSASAAATSLLRSAEFALPKQKRALAVTEYKHAVVASKRKSKTNQEEQGPALLPQDVLVHIFSFLDVQSLVSASAVCRLWNFAASDNHLWRLLYDDKMHSPDDGRVDWRCAFKTAFKESSFRKFKSYRGYCSSCRSIVWVHSYKCPDKLETKQGCNHQLSPISRQQIVEYIFFGGLLLDSDSDSESDTEDGQLFKLWAYPRCDT